MAALLELGASALGGKTPIDRFCELLSKIPSGETVKVAYNPAKNASASPALDSLSKCDTEVGGESLNRRAVAEALSRRCIQVPDHVVDVGIGIPFKAGLTGKVATKTPVSVLD